jgi:hypothetical protein
MTSGIQALTKVRYAPFLNPLADVDTLARDVKFVEKDLRQGRSYNYPIQLGQSHGVTIDDTDTAFPTNGAISPTYGEVSIVGGSIVVEEDIPLPDVHATENGISNGGGQGGAYMGVWDEKTKACMKGGNLYRELQLLCGPGTTSTAAASLGTIHLSHSGANLGAGQVVSITRETWRPGLWPNMANAKVDVYQSDGTTLRDSGVTVTLNALTETSNRITLTKAASVAVVAGGDILLVRGAIDKSCYGLEAIAANAGSLFGIDAAAVPQWKVQTFPVSGSLDRDQILGAMAKLSPHGLKGGGKLYVSDRTLIDLISETMDLQTFTSSNGTIAGTKELGGEGVKFKTPIGDVEVVVHPYFMQSFAFFMPNKPDVRAVRVGATDLTFSNGKKEFNVIDLPSNAGMRIRLYGHQGILLQSPWHHMRFTGIDNEFDTSPA